MKKFTLAIMTIALLACMPIIASAVVDNGDVVVTISDELSIGGALDGATVEFVCPDGDGLGGVSDTSFYADDGGVNDKDGSVINSSVEFDGTDLQAASHCVNGDPFRVVVSKDGFVIKDVTNVDLGTTYTTAAPNNLTVSSVQYTIKIIVQDELSNAVSGATFDFQTATKAGTEGAGDDEDVATPGDGIMYVKYTPVGGPHTITVSKSGYISWTDAASTVNENTQTVYNVSFEYPVVIVATDELSNVLALAEAEAGGVTIAATGGGTFANVDQKIGAYGAFSGALYVACTGSGALSLAMTGYVTETTGGAVTCNSGAGPQVAVSYNGSDGAKLSYQIKVDGTIGLTDENSEALTAASADTWTVCQDQACSAEDTEGTIYVEDAVDLPTPYWDAGTSAWYALPESAGTKYMKVRKVGYIDTVEQGGIAVAAANPQRIPDFSDNGANEMMDRSLQIFAVYNEVDSTNVVAQTAGDSVTVHTSSDCSGASDVTATKVTNSDLDGNTKWILALEQGAVYYVKYNHANYISTCHATSVDLSVSTNYDFQRSITFDGTNALLFPLKVLVYDEVGTAITVSDAASSPFSNNEIVYNGFGSQVATGTASNALYYVDNGAGSLDDGAGAALNTSQGFLQINTAVDTALATVNPGDDTNGQTVITLSGTTACGAGSVAAGSAVTCNGLKYTTKFTLADELGTAITTAVVGDIQFNGADASLVSGSTLYYRANTGAALVVADDSEYVTGYNVIDTSDTFDDDLGALGGGAGVEPGTTVVTTVNFTGTVPCSVGANLAAGSTTTCSGMAFSVKVDTVNEELGNAVTINNSGETLALYTDAGCTTAATYISGPTYSGAAWYVAVANSTYYGKFTKDGYVTTDCTAVFTADQTNADTPDFTPAADSLIYNVKLGTVEDELGNTISGAGTGVLIVNNADGAGSGDTEDFAVYTDSGCTVEATYIENGPGTNDATYDTNVWYAAVAKDTAYYVKFTEGGLVPKCHSVSATPDGTAAQTFNFTTTNRLQYPAIIYVYDELGTAITTLGAQAANTGDTIGLTNGAEATGSPSGNALYFYKTGVSAGLTANSRAVGYVDIAVGTDTQLATINWGTSTSTVVILNGGATACSTGITITANQATSCSGLDFNVKLAQGEANTEIGTAGSAIELDGTATLEAMHVYTDAVCGAGEDTMVITKAGTTGYDATNDAYYFALAEGAAYYASLQDAGFAKECSGDVALNADGSAQLTPDFMQAGGNDHGLSYLIAVTTIQDELGSNMLTNLIDGAGSEALTVFTDVACTTGATTIDVTYNDGTIGPEGWLAAPAVDGTYYLKLYEPGYVAECSGTTIPGGIVITHASEAQNVIAFDGTGGTDPDGLDYNVIFQQANAEDELATGQAIDGSATEDFQLFNDSSCTVEASYLKEAVGGTTDAVRSGTSWYAAIAAGTYYTKYTDTGYIGKCGAVTVVPDGATQAVADHTDASASGIQFPFQVWVYDELGTALTLDGTADISIVNGTYAGQETNIRYYTDDTGAGGAMADGMTGFVNIDNTVDTDLAAVAPGVTSPTIVKLDGSLSACTTGGGAVAAGATVSCRGLLYNVKFSSVENEIGTAVNLDASAGEGVSLYSAATCLTGVTALQGIGAKNGYDSGTDAYYYAVNTTENTLYVRYTETGYANTGVSGCTAALVDPVDTAVVTPDWTDGTGGELLYAYKIAQGSVNEELANAVALDGNGSESLTVWSDANCTSAVTTYDKTYDAGTDAWYAAVGTGTHYLKFYEPGFVPVCNTSANAQFAGGVQLTPAFTVADLGALPYAVKVTTVKDENGGAITLDDTDQAYANEDFAIYTDAGCTVEATYRTYEAGASDAIFDTVSYYVAVDPGTYYVKFSEPNFIPKCNATSVVVAGISSLNSQVLTTFQDVNALQFPVMLVVYDELGGALDATAHNFVLGATAGEISTTTQKIVYFEQEAAGPSAITGGITGYIDIDTTTDDTKLANVNYGTFAAGQTVITMGVSGAADGGAKCAGASVTAGAAEACSGLDFNLKISGALTDELTGAITQDGVGNEAASLFTGADCTSANAYAGAISALAYDSGTGAYYAAIQEATAVRVKFFEPGYMEECSATDTTDGTYGNKASPVLGTFNFGMLINDVNEELDNDLTINSTDTVAIYTESTCTTASTLTAQYNGGSWYVDAPDQTGTDASVYVKYGKGGYVSTCGSAAVTLNNSVDDADYGQKNPSFAVANGVGNPKIGGLLYNIKLGATTQNELSTDISADITGTANESFEIHSVNTCTNEQTTKYMLNGAGAADAIYAANIWYIAAEANNTYYLKLGDTDAGYLYRCHDTTVTPLGTAQMVVDFTGSTNGLRFPLNVQVYDQFGTSIDVQTAGHDLTVGANAADATVGNKVYFLDSGAGILAGGTPGYVDVAVGTDTELATVNFGTASPTAVILGYIATPGTGPFAAACTTDAVVADGDEETCSGLLMNTFIGATTVENELGEQLTLDESTNESIEFYSSALNCAANGGTDATVQLAKYPLTAGGFYTGADAADGYYFAIAEGGGKEMRVAEDGYVDRCVTIAPSGAAVTNPDLTDATGSPLSYSLKISSFHTEANSNTWDINSGGAMDVINGVNETLTVYDGTDSCNSGVVAPINIDYDATTDAWYVALLTSANYRVKFYEVGFLEKCSDAAVVIDTTDAQMASKGFTNTGGEYGVLQYSLVVNLATEMGEPLKTNALVEIEPQTMLADLTYMGVQLATATNGFTYADETSNSAYFAYEGAATAALEINPTGYVKAKYTNTVFDGGITTGHTAQTIINLGANAACLSATPIGGTTVSCMGLRYQIKAILADEFDNNKNFDDANMVSAQFNSNDVTYSAPGTNVAYWAGTGAASSLRVHYKGYVYSDVTNTGLASFTPNSWGQTVLTFATDTTVPYGLASGTISVPAGPAPGGDTANTVRGLQAGIRVNVYDEYGTSLPNGTTDTVVTHGGTAVVHESDNEFYFNTTVAGDLAATKVQGYISLDTAVDTGLTNFSYDPAYQIVIDLKGDAVAGNTPLATGAGSLYGSSNTFTASGLKYNTIISVKDDNNSQLVSLGNLSNFWFYDGTNTRFDAVSTGLYNYKEATEVGAGIYKFALKTSAGNLSLVVKDVDYDVDANIDMRDSATSTITVVAGSELCANLGSTSAGCGNNPIQVFKRVDYVLLSHTDTYTPAEAEAGDGSANKASDTIQILYYTDNAARLNAAVAGDGSGGSPNSPDNAAEMTLTLTGGAAGSQKSIVWTNCATETPAPAPAGAGAVTTLDCVPFGGAAATGSILVRVADTIPTGTLNKLVLTVTKKSGSLPNDNGQAAGYNVTEVEIVPGPIDHYDVTCGTPNVSQINNAAFTSDCTITAKDDQNNVITGYDTSGDQVNLTLTGGIAGGAVGQVGSFGDAFILATQFTSGVANLSTAHTTGVKYLGTIGQGSLVATSMADGTATGSGALSIIAGTLTSIDVSCGDQRVNEVFSACILRAKDTSGNTILNFATSGTTITLTMDNDFAAGTITGGVADGATIDDSYFVDGVANLSSTSTPMIIYNGLTGTGDLIATADSPVVVGQTSGNSITMLAGDLASYSIACNGGSHQNGIPLGAVHAGYYPAGGCTLTALDGSSNIITDFSSGTVTVTATLTSAIAGTYDISGGAGAGGDEVSSASFVTGVANLNTIGITYTGTAGSGNLVATTVDAISGNNTGSQSITVVAGNLDSYAVTCGGRDQINAAALTTDCTVTAQDVSANVITDYASGTTAITTTMSVTGGLATGDISGGDGGAGDGLAVGDFTAGIANLNTKGIIYTGIADTGNLVATSDAATGGKTGQVSVTVIAGALDDYRVNCSEGGTLDQVNSVPFEACTITARDVSDNTALNFATSSIVTTISTTLTGDIYGGQGVGADEIPSTSFVSGVATLSSTSTTQIAYLGTIGTGTLTATSDAGSGSKTGADISFQIIPGNLNYYVVNCSANETNATVLDLCTAKVYDVSSNIITDFDTRALYATYVTVLTNSLGGTISDGVDNEYDVSNYTLGIATLDFMTYTGITGTGVLTATKQSGTETGTGSITIEPGALNSYVVTCNNVNQTVNATFTTDCTVTAKDVSSNTITDYDTDATYVGCVDIIAGGNLDDEIDYTEITGGGNGGCAANELDETDFVLGIANLNTVGMVYSGKYTTNGNGTITADNGTVNNYGSIHVLPGVLNQFDFTCGAVAQRNGETFTNDCVLTAQDLETNPIHTFATSGTTVTISENNFPGDISGGQGAGGDEIVISDFDGTGQVVLSSVGTGLKFTATDGALATPPGTPWAAQLRATAGIITKDLNIDLKSGSVVDNFLVDCGMYTEVRSGEAFKGCSVTARDESNATIDDYAGGATVSLTGTTISGTYMNADLTGDFTNGIVNLETIDGTGVSYVGTTDGSATLRVAEGAASGTLSIAVKAGSLDDFGVSCTTTQQNDLAPLSGTCTVTALDAAGNAITDFNTAGQYDLYSGITSVTLSSNLGGAVTDAGLTKADFGATGIVDLTTSGTRKYTGTYGTGTLIATADDVGTTASSGVFIVRAGILDDYAVSCAGSQTNDAVFSSGCNVTARDVSDNVITDFATHTLYTGINTSLTTGGVLTGAITDFTSDNVLLNTDFSSGIADLNALGVKYNGIIGTGTLIATSDVASGNKTGNGALTIIPGILDDYVIACDDQTNAVAFTGTCTITALDVNDNVIDSFNGETTLSTTGALTGALSSTTIGGASGLNFASGVANLATLGISYTGQRGVGTLVATSASPAVTQSGALVVNPGALDDYAVTCGSVSQTNDATFTSDCTVTARDVSDNVIVGFELATSTVIVTTISTTGFTPGVISGGTSTGNANEIANTAFVSGVANLNTLGMKFTGIIGTGTLVATSDVASGSKTGNVAMTVVPGAIDHFVMEYVTSATATVGLANPMKVTAKDVSENVKTDYLGTITLTPSATSTIVWALTSGAGTFTNGAPAAGQATYAYNAADNGELGVSVTSTVLSTITLSTAGDGKTDDATHASMVVVPGSLANFVITHDAAAVAGVAETVTLTAKDSYSNTKYDYDGTVTLSLETGTASKITWASTTGNGTFADNGDGTATYTYVAADVGILQFTITDTLAESIDIKATDATLSKTDDETSADLVVAPAPIDRFVLLWKNTGKKYAGIAQKLSLTAEDQYANTITTYATTVTISLSVGTAANVTIANDTGSGTFTETASGTATYAFVTGDNGVLNFKVTDTKAEFINVAVSGDGKADNDAEGQVEIEADASDLATDLPAIFTTGANVTTVSGTADTLDYDNDCNIPTVMTGLCSKTGKWDTVSYTDTLSATTVVLQYPTTSSSVRVDMVPADYSPASNDYSVAQIKIVLVDAYGNPIEGVKLMMASSLAAARTAGREAHATQTYGIVYVNATTNTDGSLLTTNASGEALYSVSTDSAGTYNFTLYYIDDNGAQHVLKTFAVSFAATDTKAPEIDVKSAMAGDTDGIAVATIADGDIFGINQKLTLSFTIDDTPILANETSSGVNTTLIKVTVTAPGSTTEHDVVTGVDNTNYTTVADSSEATWSTQNPICYFDPATNGGEGACTIFSNNRAKNYNTSVESTLTDFNTPGYYSIKLYVTDNAGNQSVYAVSIRLTSAVAFEEVHTLPNPFYVDTYDNTRITFQAAQAGSVSVELYNSTGRLIWTTSQAVGAGYNQILWNGKDLGGNRIANGIYFYRLTGNFPGGSVDAKGKIAVIKR